MAISTLIRHSLVTNHKSYLRAINLANDYLRNPQEMKQLLDEAQAKINDVAGQSLAAVGDGLNVLLRILKAYASGQYRAIPWRTLAVITAAIVYFVMPLDFLPDLLPLVGLMDDVALIAWTISQVKVDVDRFLDWEQSQREQSAAAQQDAVPAPATDAGQAAPAGNPPPAGTGEN